MGSSLGKSVQENPIPLILTGTGIAWMMSSPGRRSTARSDDLEPLTNPGAMFLALLQKHRPVWANS